MTDKRPDESDDYRQRDNLDSSVTSQPILTDVELNANMDYRIRSSSSSDVTGSSVGKMQRFFDGFVNILCGIERSFGNDDTMNVKHELQKYNESKRRVENFYSLNQTKFQKNILNFNLAIIVIISVSLYVFFSIPPETYLFNNVHLFNSSALFNQTFRY